jgi:hypothetical protein
MQFRWVAFIALWTALVGPILGSPSGPTSSARPPVKTGKAAPASTPAPPR